MNAFLIGLGIYLLLGVFYAFYTKVFVIQEKWTPKDVLPFFIFVILWLPLELFFRIMRGYENWKAKQ